MSHYRWSLRLALSTPFVIVIAGSLAIMSYAHYRTIDDMSAHQTNSTLLASTAYTESELRLLLDSPFRLQRMTAVHIVQKQLIRPDDIRPLQRYLRTLFEEVYRDDLDWIDMIQVGTTYGDFIGFSEKIDLGEPLFLHLKDQRTNGNLEVSDLKTGVIQRTHDQYDPRIRPWYQPAAEARTPLWTPPYAASTNPFDIGISATFPVLTDEIDEDGESQLLGVLGSDINLVDLTKVIREAPLIKSFPTALSYIIADREGHLIAVSDGSPLVHILSDGHHPQLHRAADSSNALIANSYKAIRSGLPLDTVQHIPINGSSHAVMASNFKDPYGLDWLIVSVVPTNELTDSSLQQAHLALALSVLLSGIGLLLGLLVIRRTAKPFRQTANAASTLAISDTLDTELPALPTMTQSRITESVQLTRAFHTMAQRIAMQVQRLKEMALKDPVTGLLNLRGLLASADWHEPREVVLVALGVNDYARVQATLHANAGEKLLQALTKRLVDCVPETACCARSEAAEFLFLLQGTSRLDQTLEALQNSFSAPVYTSLDELRLSASIGVAQAYCSGDEVAARLHGEATLALGAARQPGSSALVYFDESLLTAATSKTRLLGELTTTVEQRALQLYYQPVVELSSGRIIGLEALARWPHPTLGLISPGQFITLAEESGLIVSLGTWVFEQAVRDAALLRRELGLSDDFFVNVNVSVRQMMQSDFVDVVNTILTRSVLPPSTLKIEVTESLLMQDDKSTRQTAQALEEIGVALALDDFGTGYSSLSYLTSFHFHTIKIDRSLLLSAIHSEQGLAILKAALELTRGLKAQCVVEGVEDASQIKLLCDLGFTLAQGFYFSRPAPLNEVQHMLKRGFIGY